MFKIVKRCIREYAGVSIITPILVLGEVFLEVLIPFIIAELVNRIKAGCSMDELLKYALILIIMSLSSLAFGGVAGLTCSTAACGLGKNLRKDMFYRIQNFSFDNIDRFSTSSLVTRMTTDIMNVQNSYMMIIRSVVRSPIMLIFAVIMAFKMGGRLALVFVVVIPLLGFGLIYIALKVMPIFRSVFRKYDKLNSSVQENIKGMRVVKSFVREEYEKVKFKDAAEEVCKDFTKAERILALNGPIMQLCMYTNMIVVMGIGSKIVIESRGTQLDIGQLSSLITYGVMILMSLMMASMVFVMMTLSAESAARIEEVLEENSNLNNPENPVMEVKDGSISFKGVDFAYASNPKNKVLKGINIDIASGETIGIIGATGSSKSSLIQLISRLYDTTEGSVSVGGVDVRDYDLVTLRDAVSVVLQKNVLFSGTIKENLRWGNLNATDEEIMEACRLACADEFIETFPDKYDSYIEQGGTNVSGGQKQRLCIARALLKRPKVIIFDDSTSAVDTRTDAKIRKAMREYIPDTTKIIIAQRTASVEDADRIIVMDAGRITAIGPHDELIKKNKLYREIYISQNKADADAAIASADANDVSNETEGGEVNA